MKDHIALAEFTFPILERAKRDNIRFKVRTEFDDLQSELETLLESHSLSDRAGLTEQFHPRSITLTEKTGFFIEARTSKGELVGLVAQRLDDLGQESLEEFIRRYWLRTFEAENGMPISFSPRQDPELKRLKGRLVYQGELWVRPDYRAAGANPTRLAEQLVQLGMVAAYQAWEFDYIYAIVRKKEYIRGAPMIWGYRSFIQLGFNWDKKPKNVRIDNAIGYNSCAQFINKLEMEIELNADSAAAVTEYHNGAKQRAHCEAGAYTLPA